MSCLRSCSVGLVILFLWTLKSQAANTVIHNNCDFPVWVWEVPHSTETVAPLANGHKIEPGRCFANKLFHTGIGGIAVKLSLHPSLDGPSGPYGITQFEYTITPADPSKMWYDMSNVDCDGHQTIKGDCPFWQHGMMLINGNCVSETCVPGERNCREIYQVWNDDKATKFCDLTDNHDAEVFLCSAKSTRIELKGYCGKASQCDGLTGAGRSASALSASLQPTASSPTYVATLTPAWNSISTWISPPAWTPLTVGGPQSAGNTSSSRSTQCASPRSSKSCNQPAKDMLGLRSFSARFHKRHNVRAQENGTETTTKAKVHIATINVADLVLACCFGGASLITSMAIWWWCRALYRASVKKAVSQDSAPAYVSIP